MPTVHVGGVVSHLSLTRCCAGTEVRLVLVRKALPRCARRACDLSDHIAAVRIAYICLERCQFSVLVWDE